MLKKVFSSSKYRIIFSFIFGSISSFSFSPFYFFPIIFFSYIYLFFILIYSNSFLESFLLGYVFGFGQSLFCLYWIAMAFVKGDAGGFLLGVPAILIICIFLALFTGLPSMILFYLRKKMELAEGKLNFFVKLMKKNA